MRFEQLFQELISTSWCSKVITASGNASNYSAFSEIETVRLLAGISFFAKYTNLLHVFGSSFGIGLSYFRNSKVFNGRQGAARKWHTDTSSNVPVPPKPVHWKRFLNWKSKDEYGNFFMHFQAKDGPGPRPVPFPWARLWWWLHTDDPSFPASAQPGHVFFPIFVLYVPARPHYVLATGIKVKAVQITATRQWSDDPDRPSDFKGHQRY